VTRSFNHLEELRQRTQRPGTPGELLDCLLEEHELTQGELAKRLGVARATINRLIQGRISLTIDLAQRLGRFFGNGPAVWMAVQDQVDLWDLLHADQSTYDAIAPLSDQQQPA